MDMNKVATIAPSHNDSKIVTFGLSVIFIVFIALGGWMAYAPLASSSVAPGKVSADLEKKTVQHLEGGKIEKIYVQNGDVVKKGDILIKLNDVQVQSQFKLFKAQYQDAIAVLARLRAHIDNKKSIDFPANLTDETIKNDQNHIFSSINKSIENEKKITQNKIIQIRKQIEGTNSLTESKKKRLLSMQEEVQEWQELYKQKLVDKQRIRDLQREENRIEGDIASNISQVGKLEEQISETQAQQALKEKEFNKENLQQYVKVKETISDLQSKITASTDILKRSNILAPIDGTVVGLKMHTIGGVISRGEPILEIIPKNSKLLIVVNVKTTDIDKVKVGLEADVTLPAFNMRQIHVIKGRVVYVSADTYADKKTGAQYYEAKVEITKEGMKTLKENNFVLVPGMPAQAMIQIGDRTALSYLVKPFKDMLMRSFNEE